MHNVGNIVSTTLKHYYLKKDENPPCEDDDTLYV